MSGVIEHLCANPNHCPPWDVPEPVVIYAGALAYCPLGECDGHDWRATGGKTLATVREWLGRPAMRAADPIAAADTHAPAE